MKALSKIFDALQKDSQVLLLTAFNEQPSSRLTFSLRMTPEGGLIIKDTDRVWRSYALRGFVPVAGMDVVSPSQDLDLLIEEVLGALVSTLRAGDPVREMIIRNMGGLSS